MAVERSIVSRERVVNVINGWAVLLPLIAMVIADVAYLANGRPDELRLLTCMVVLGLGVFGFVGFFSLQPNEARVLTLFGAYKGTVRTSGFWWGNPLYGGGRQGFAASGLLPSRQFRTKPASASAPGQAMGRMKVSLRARTLNGERLKVNDKRGNPIEIAAVVVWRIDDTAQAFFDVDDYENYVPIQSESALRHIANMYSYDDGEGTETTLRNNPDEVSEALRTELQARLAKAGVVVDEARLTHLAYAPEIAQVMLRRQQAEAVIAARQKIVQGAVGMVEMALTELSARGFVSLDDERKAAMVSNLMVVLCSESEVHPVVNTGTLYS
ncbi:SPFH domain-containing protein [Granulicella sp. S156]|uniref:SPFH domain-containing protein n=1 Tax=Granulicella sp. S156 TaxID=1747224 RepID=UPI001575750B|nr:SPFH domain-containing protein [Granulicella sp. S156]